MAHEIGDSQPGEDTAPYQFPMRRSGCPFDPPPEYARLRSAVPAATAELADGRKVRLVTRLADARAVLTDSRVSGDLRSEGFPLPGGGAQMPPGMRPPFARMDPPDHAVFRRLLLPDFTVRRVREMRPRIGEIVSGVLDEMGKLDQPADLVQALALPVPSLVICDMLGIPYADHDFFQSLAKVMLSRSSTQQQLIATLGEMRTYMLGLLEVKRREPGDDIITRLVQAQAAGGRDGRELSDIDLAITAQTVLNAGHETTANMIALGTLYLLEHPATLATIKANPELWPGAVEELLRYLSIGDLVSPRAATEDVPIGGETISSGQGLYVLNAAANRDPEAFADPDTFDLRRTDSHHLAFGYGVHQCLGQHLARAELEIVFSALFDRWPDLRLAASMDELSFKHDAAIYGLHAMPVFWAAEKFAEGAQS